MKNEYFKTSYYRGSDSTIQVNDKVELLTLPGHVVAALSINKEEDKYPHPCRLKESTPESFCLKLIEKTIS